MVKRLLNWTGLLLVATSSLGCSQHATFVQQRPAKVNAPIRRLAVLESRPQREEGHQAMETLWAELQRSERFELIGQEQLQPAAPAPLVTPSGSTDRPVAIEASRRMGVDGLLITRVRFLEKDGTVYGTKTVRIGDPEVHAAIRYELIDVRTGRILEKNALDSESFRGEMNPHTPGPSRETKILSRLAASGGKQVAHVLVPHEAEVQVKLASATFGPGSAEIRKGTDYAQAGDWENARQQWMRAAEADPQNAAAVYNLAVAHEALGEFALARRALELAAGEKPTSLQQEALQRVARAEAELQLASAATSQRIAKLPPVDPLPPPSQSQETSGVRERYQPARYEPATTGGTFWR